MVALSSSDDAIVVLDDPRACIDEGALRAELPPLPSGSVLSVVVVVGGSDGAGAARVQLERPTDPAWSRIVVIEPAGCAVAAAIVARVVARHLEDLPASAWPARAVAADTVVADEIVADEGIDEIGADEVITDATDVARVEAGVVGSVVVGAAGFQRVSVRPVVRGLAPTVALGDQLLWLGGDVSARVGGLLPVGVGAGRVAGVDAVVGVAARASWARWSTSLGIEGGVLGVQGVGFAKDALAIGPTANATAAVGMSFSPVWIDVVTHVPLVRATFTGDAATVTETPLYVGIAVGGFVGLWP